MAGKVLVVYYSHSGNTRKLATMIAEKSKGTLVEIVLEKAYSSEYRVVVDQAKKELEEGHRPVIKTQIKNMAGYDTVFVGTPNWWSTVAPPMQTFLETYDFAGKAVLPFCTHGGGGSGYIEKTVKHLCSEANVLAIFAGYGSSTKKSEVDKWLEKNKLPIN